MAGHILQIMDFAWLWPYLWFMVIDCIKLWILRDLIWMWLNLWSMIINTQKSPKLCWIRKFGPFDSIEREISIFLPKIFQNFNFRRKIIWTRLWCGKLCGQAGGDGRLLGGIQKIDFLIFGYFSINRLFTWGEWASIALSEVAWVTENLPEGTWTPAAPSAEADLPHVSGSWYRPSDLRGCDRQSNLMSLNAG